MDRPHHKFRPSDGAGLAPTDDSSCTGSGAVEMTLEPVPLTSFIDSAASPVNLYLRLDSHTVVCRREGEIIDLELRRQLLEAGTDLVWMECADRCKFQRYLQESVLERWNQPLDEESPDRFREFSREFRREDPMPAIIDILEPIRIDQPEFHARCWRVAHYGTQLAEAMGRVGTAGIHDIIAGLLLHEVVDARAQVSLPTTLTGGTRQIIEGWRERIDGTGPLGWGPDKMKLPLRIACAAIAYDHRTSGDGGRPRQPAFDVLREFIIREHGAIDPTVIAAFIRLLDR